MNKPFHHGNLKQAILDIALSHAEKDGIESLKLRALAREVGVDVAALYRHFQSRADLLNAVRGTAMGKLSDAMTAALEKAGDETKSQLLAVARAYIEFGETNPGLYRDIWVGPRRNEKITEAAQGLNGQTPWDIILRLLKPHSSSEKLIINAEPVWSAIHGLTSLTLSGQLDEAREFDDRLHTLVHWAYGMVSDSADKLTL